MKRMSRKEAVEAVRRREPDCVAALTRKLGSRARLEILDELRKLRDIVADEAKAEARRHWLENFDSIVRFAVDRKTGRLDWLMDAQWDRPGEVHDGRCSYFMGVAREQQDMVGRITGEIASIRRDLEERLRGSMDEEQSSIFDRTSIFTDEYY